MPDNTLGGDFYPIIQNVKSWNDTYLWFNKNNQDKGKLFEQFAKLYFLTSPSYKNEYKSVWLFNEVPTHIITKLSLGKKDHGIDLILEDSLGELTVVQCKFRADQDSKISWTRDKLANLFADGDKADKFIIFSNVSGIDSHSLSKKANKLRFIGLSDLLDISEHTFDNMSLLLKGQKVQQEVKKPRDYQLEIIDKVASEFESANRGQLILPCGTGKTLISLWIKERLSAKRTIVLVPSLALLRQVKHEYSSNQNEYIPYLCVCSEKDIDKSSDTLITNIYEIGGKVTTDSKEIESFLNKNQSHLIIYSTYQSLEAICIAAKLLDFNFDLAICDEAHKTSGSKLSKHTLIHSDDNIKVSKRLYMTATPRVLGASLKEKSPDAVNYLYDMSNLDIFGKEFYRMSFKEAIDKNILVDYQIVAIGVDDEEISDAIQKRYFTTEDDTIDEIANNYALKKFMDKYNANHAITFHSSVKKAKSFVTRHQNMDNSIHSYHINGSMSTNERNILLKEFISHDRSIITNARCLTEGIDVPAIDIVYFCDPKNSRIDIVQATGRALRRSNHKDKKIGYIVVPIFHKKEDNLEDILESNQFSNLISIIRALASHDERIFDEITKIKVGKGERLISNISPILNIQNLITIEGYEDKLKETLFDQIISRVRTPWLPFEQAREFARRLKLNSWHEWKRFTNTDLMPNNIPKNPNLAYKNVGWISTGDWLGTNSIATIYMEYLPFNEARKIVHALNLKSHKEWLLYCKSGKKPNNIPAKPSRTYKGVGWVSSGDWLGTGRIADQLRKMQKFEDARDYVRSLKLRTVQEWKDYCKSGLKPHDIPAQPQDSYKNKGWISWGDWLGTFREANFNIIYLSFEEARDFAQSLKLKSIQEWRLFCKSNQVPPNIPRKPDHVYRNKGWVNWGDWLGTYTVASFLKVYLSFEEARKFVRALGLQTKTQWLQYCKSGYKPDNIPFKPCRHYKNKGWISWDDWLGKNNK
ncbi:MAG: DEAD/DEAH box helicase family protein [Alphaproteobacteria bacterium]|nr:DEAD/DEAH box helicase family protein [Alphaproteobacteria bacterium]OJV15266.1 MAG: hypothetical protein BGO27_02020 [Alphaproteobacteria bacterium 33-17]